VGALSDAFVCVWPKSRTERPRKTNIGTDVAHVTRDSDIIAKVKKSRSPGRFTHRRVGASCGCSGGRENGLAVGNCCYVAVCSAEQGASAPTGRGEGRGIPWRLPAYNLFITIPAQRVVILANLVLWCHQSRICLIERVKHTWRIEDCTVSLKHDAYFHVKGHKLSNPGQIHDKVESRRGPWTVASESG